MRTCALCPEWAQYRLRKRVFRAVNDGVWDADKQYFQKKTVNVPDWADVAVLCGVHKDDRCGVPADVEMRRDFIGAMPLKGIPCS